jgi:hypothetical protein
MGPRHIIQRAAHRPQADIPHYAAIGEMAAGDTILTGTPTCSSSKRRRPSCRPSGLTMRWRSSPLLRRPVTRGLIGRRPRWVGRPLIETSAGLRDARFALALVERLPVGQDALHGLARRR